MTEKLSTFGEGRSLFKQGDASGDLYFIKEGQVELSIKNAETGEPTVIATLGNRSVIGTMSFLEGEPRSATAVAKTKVTCVVIPQTQREKLLSTVPTWLNVLVKDLASNLRRMNEKCVTMQNDLAKTKKNLELRERQKRELEDKMTQKA